VWRLTTRRASTGQVFAAAAVVEMAAAALERSICLDWARVGAGQGNSVEDKRVRLESEDFDARWLRRGVLADRDNGTLQVHVHSKPILRLPPSHHGTPTPEGPMRRSTATQKTEGAEQASAAAPPQRRGDKVPCPPLAKHVAGSD
jgi:hypothetical protein